MIAEPVHGSAPDIAGQGIANPVAAIRSAAMLLTWLGHPNEAQRIESAVDRVLKEANCLTKDLGGQAKTEEMTREIIHFL